MVSSSSTPLQKYDVFLSFRGEDTRNNLVSHLHAALKQRGIITFFDEENLEKGQSITPELLKSIEESKFAIIVFSKNYASSTWCLDELVKIMECRTKYNLTVIPIFYHIDPSDIRKQKNNFAESFAIHEVTFKDHKEKVIIWKEKLTETAKISGYDFRDIPEAPLINKIVEEIFSKLPLKASTKGLFGIEHRLKKVRSLLAREPNDVCFLGIWGMGGIGKTTTASAIFNELIDEFEGGCFLQDVCKRSMMDLQKSLLSQVLRTTVDIWDENQGSNLIRKRLGFKRVLLVLDDVNNVNQLEPLAGDKEWFGKGSRVIVTTRDKHLMSDDTYELYNIETLPYNEAMQLFCWHAFKKGHQSESFDQLVDSLVRYAGGLPLALRVLGSHLRDRQEDAWKCTIDKLKENPDKAIMTTLKISFDGLEDHQKNIFLDIACFFRGHYKDSKDGYDHKDKVNIKLDSFGFYPVIGIPDLIDKCLIHMESNGCIQMHDLIQEMGRQIVRQKANKKPERYSRLWDHEEIIDVLTKGTGTGEVEALVYGFGHWEKIKLSEGAFKDMKMLRLLDLTGDKLVGEPNYLPNSLRWLSWSGYPGKSLPENFQPRNLVNLKLSESKTLETFPDITCIPNLEFLNLSRCRKLLEVLPSVVAVHKKLIHINLDYCEKLKKFPRRLKMKSLETLKLSNCHELHNLPEFHSSMICLRTLDLCKMKLKEYPRSIGRLTGLQEINLSFCAILEDKDNEVFNVSRMLTLLLTLPSLTKVEMKFCDISDIILPESINCLTSLEELDLRLNGIVFLPESINRFSSLQVLRLKGSKIKELPELPASITVLVLDKCRKLISIPHPVALLDKYENLCILSLVGCEQLEIEFLLDWISLTNVLSRRHEALQLCLPPMKTFSGLYQKMGSNTTVTLSPSWYNYKLRGFVILSISKVSNYRVVAMKNFMTIIPKGKLSCGEHNAILYIPIGKITSGRDWNEQKDCCLLKVTNDFDVESWGIRLVYDGDNAPNDISDIIIVNHDVETVNHDEETVSHDEETDSDDSYEDSVLKICVEGRNQRQ